MSVKRFTLFIIKQGDYSLRKDLLELLKQAELNLSISSTLFCKEGEGED